MISRRHLLAGSSATTALVLAGLAVVSVSAATGARTTHTTRSAARNAILLPGPIVVDTTTDGAENSNALTAGYCSTTAVPDPLYNLGLCTLRAAVQLADANPGSTIQLTGGTTYVLSIAATGPDDATTGDLNLSADVTITATGGSQAVVTGSDTWADRILRVKQGTTALHNVRLTHGQVSSGGGIALVSEGATLTATQSRFDHGTSGLGLGSGGCLASAGHLDLQSVEVDHCATAYNGGGISTSGSAAVTSISRSTIHDNIAAYADGGGFFTSAPANTVSDTTFAHNTAMIGAGGGMYVGGPITARDVVSEDNSARSGGGICHAALSGASTYSRIVVARNSAISGGGIEDAVIPASGPVPTVGWTDITAYNNVASGFGGSDYTFGSGGGVFEASHVPVTWTGVTLNNNEAMGPGGGGGLFVSDHSTLFQFLNAASPVMTPPPGAITFVNTTVTSNKAKTGTGTGIASQSVNAPAHLTLLNDTVAGNVPEPLVQTPATRRAATRQELSTPPPAGLYVGATTVFAMSNTIVSGNLVNGEVNCTIATTAVTEPFGHNLYDVPGTGAGACPIAGAGDRTGDPQLQPLALDHATPDTFVSTMAIPATSPAFDAADTGHGPTTDARHVSRPQGAASDIGAYELAVAAPTTPTATPTAMPTAAPTTPTTTPTAAPLGTVIKVPTTGGGLPGAQAGLLLGAGVLALVTTGLVGRRRRD